MANASTMKRFKMKGLNENVTIKGDEFSFTLEDICKKYPDLISNTYESCGPAYIMPDGRFLLSGKRFEMHEDLAVQSLMDIQGLTYDEIDDEYDMSNMTELFTLFFKLVRVNDGSEVDNRTYFVIPYNSIPQSQLDSVQSFVDYILKNKFSKKIYYMSAFVGTKLAWGRWDLSEDISSDTIMSDVKFAMTRGFFAESLNESIRLVDKGNKNVFYTDSAYDLKNYIVNNVQDKLIRIVYYPDMNLYCFCDGDKGIHDMLEEMVLESGLVGSDDTCERYLAYGKNIPHEDAIDYKNDVTIYEYSDFLFAIVQDYGYFASSRLAEALGTIVGRYEWQDWKIVEESLKESLLLEKNRQDLLNKSRSSDNYTSKDRQGENRFTRRLKSQIANSVRDYNRIDMDAFWKGDILDFDVRVHGETDDYVVSLDFSNILRRLQDEVKANKDRLEFKCVLRALVGAFNSDSDLLVSCTCPDWKYRQAYWATKGGYNSGQPQPSNGKAIANPHDTKGGGCKHVNLVLSNLDWMMKIASVINNYIKWTRDNMGRNYADYIFPKVYGMPYKKAVQLSLLDKEDKFGDAILPSDIDTINQAIDRGMIGKDEKGKFTKGNEYRFQKQKEEQPEDNPDQLKLDIDNDDKEENRSIHQDERDVNVRFEKEPHEREEDEEDNIKFEK